MDPSWSPAADLQAQDRAFRIGQRRDVHVFRLVAAGGGYRSTAQFQHGPAPDHKSCLVLASPVLAQSQPIRDRTPLPECGSLSWDHTHRWAPLPCAGTIEEIVYQRQLYKQQQANVAVEGQDEFRFFEGEAPRPAAMGSLTGSELH